jgi:hypothetical protein
MRFEAAESANARLSADARANIGNAVDERYFEAGPQRLAEAAGERQSREARPGDRDIEAGDVARNVSFDHLRYTSSG